MRPHDNFEPIVTKRTRRRIAPKAAPPDSTPSTYCDRGTQRGPQPPPEWVVTSDKAWDTDLGILKTGKEAEVSLVERAVEDQSVVMASKRYREITHRGFRNDAAYRAGRRMRDERAQKAAEQGTAKGAGFRALEWATNEFDVLAAVWARGAAVPYPVQRRGTVLMLQYLGDEDEAAPRLVNCDLDHVAASALYDQAVELMRDFADAGIVHGDLSPYNLLVWEDKLWAIDVPQAVDLFINPNGPTLLTRDIANVCGFFARHDVAVDEAAIFADLMKRAVG